ncbi:MAG: lipoyl(octanoyl) transferase LipB [Prevotellaceae bacterium]|jgi:lipoyl(octanoyl) transferase|nr:lipoyl(octanoyl) transferase LipB [Prevotellaceae bacterium]
MNNTILYRDWGIIEYHEAWEEQETIFNETIKKKKLQQPTDNFLIFCEHPHVYTLGKSGKEENMLLNYIQLQAKNASFVHTDRGGDITYHGFGQIVGYPIFDLDNFNLGLKQYIHKIEDCMIDLLKLYDINATRLEKATGVWLDADNKNARKICAIGVRSSKFVTMHGFALNVNTNLDYFSHINPCGFVDKGVTSMEKELGQKLDFTEVKEQLRTIIENYFRQILFDIYL